MYVAICTLNISYTNPWYTGLYIVCTCLYDSKRVYKCIYMYIHVWTMCIHVYTSECTYHVLTMYRRVYTFAEMYKHVHACIYISRNVYTMYVCGRTIVLYIHGTDMVQTCLYTFMPGGQDSRCVAVAAICYWSIFKNSPNPIAKCAQGCRAPRGGPPTLQTWTQ
jgi:hypothetical protein